MADASRHLQPPHDSAELRDAALLFEMASHPSLLRLLLSLSAGAKDSCLLAEESKMDGELLSAPLATLIHTAGLVTRRFDGARTVYSLTGLGLNLVGAYRLVSDGRGCVRRDDAPRIAPPNVARLFNHAAHPLRLKMLLALTAGEQDSRQMAGEIGGVSPEVVSGNLRLMLSGHLVACEHHGQRSTYVLSESGRGVVDVILATYRRLAGRRGGFSLWPEPIDATGPISYEELALLLKSFADACRMRLLHLLGSAGAVCDCHLLQVINAPRANLKNALASLASAGFILAEEEAWTRYRLAKPAAALYESLEDSFGDRLAEAGAFEADSKRLAALVPCSKPRPARRSHRTA